VLDCCHSATVTRSDDGGYTYRGVELERYSTEGDDLPDVPLEEEVVPDEGVRDFRAKSRFANVGLTSHVLLAACAADQQAREKDNQGLFTGELLRLLGSGHAKFTYNSLISSFRELAG
jgi:hypothetical protein